MLQTILDKIFSWQAVAFVAILAFGGALRTLLTKGQLNVGVGKTGINVAASAIALQGNTTEIRGGLTEEAERRLREVRNVNVPRIVQNQEQNITRDLGALGLTQGQQIELLVRHLATTQLLHRAEFTYRTIFGSQLAILKALNTTGTKTRDFLLHTYEGAKEQFPRVYRDYSFEQYLNYLLGVELIQLVPQHPEQFQITDGGREFLRWMVDAGLTDAKPF